MISYKALLSLSNVGLRTSEARSTALPVVGWYRLKKGMRAGFATRRLDLGHDVVRHRAHIAGGATRKTSRRATAVTSRAQGPEEREPDAHNQVIGNDRDTLLLPETSMPILPIVKRLEPLALGFDELPRNGGEPMHLHSSDAEARHGTAVTDEHLFLADLVECLALPDVVPLEQTSSRPLRSAQHETRQPLRQVARRAKLQGPQTVDTRPHATSLSRSAP